MESNFFESLHSYPVLGNGYIPTDYLSVDLSVNNGNIRGLDVVEGLDHFIKSKLAESSKKIAIGGYLEERDFYWSSPLFKSEAEKRTMHLGIDLWTAPMHPIYAPLQGTIQSVKYNSLALDYGYTVLLKHSIAGFTFYTLYGHLSDKDLGNLEVGKNIERGQLFAYIGHPETNGGWAPHLHLQLILDLEGNEGDYPGVCTKAMLKHYSQNCPNPELLVKNIA